MWEIELSIEGMTCAACAARVEKKLNRLGDVRASVNYATATARVFAPSVLPVQVLTAAVSQAGYTATARDEQADDGDGQDGQREADKHFGYLRRRLIVSLIFFVPLTDLSLMLSLLPSLRFPGWQWLLVGCAAPVALWCAWPFHRAALKNARHGAASMDMLVSVTSELGSISGGSAVTVDLVPGGGSRVTVTSEYLPTTGNASWKIPLVLHSLDASQENPILGEGSLLPWA